MTSAAFIVSVLVLNLLTSFQHQVMAQTVASSFPVIKSSSSYTLDTIFNGVDKSVVMITSKVSSSNLQNPQAQNASEIGSGFVYDTQGHIITASHVVDGTKLVDVTFIDGSRYTAKTIGRDPLSDIAVLQLVGSTIQPLKPLVIENSSRLRVGQQVIAIGHPFGISNTMTTGIIGQTGYLLSIPNIGVFFPDVIQTDAAINPGNSGGPLLDIQGNVIGVNSAISSQTGEFAGIGFAIPSNTVARIVPYLIKDGKYDHPWLGIAGVNLTPDLAQQLGLPRNSKGVLVASVTPGSPAADAGIIALAQNDNTPAGDIITAIDGHQVKRMEDIIAYIEEQKSVGDNVVITVIRGGQSQDLTATLQTTPLAMSQQSTGGG